MNILVLGGTRYLGIHMVWALLQQGHDITIATRGHATDPFDNKVKRIIVERTSADSMAQAFKHKSFDIVYDNLAYCSNDVKCALDSIGCERYIMTSSASVYDLHINTLEEGYNPFSKPLVWCERAAHPYGEVKRLAECALFQAYKPQNAVAVRFPFVIGKDDYTNRLYFYIQHVVHGIPMFVDNLDAQMSFVNSEEAGKFLAFLAGLEYQGVVNGSNEGTISIHEILQYVERQTGSRAIIAESGDVAPYNVAQSFSINTELASDLGFRFSPVNSFIFELIDSYIALARNQR